MTNLAKTTSNYNDSQLAQAINDINSTGNLNASSAHYIMKLCTQFKDIAIKERGNGVYKDSKNLTALPIKAIADKLAQPTKNQNAFLDNLRAIEPSSGRVRRNIYKKIADTLGIDLSMGGSIVSETFSLEIVKERVNNLVSKVHKGTFKLFEANDKDIKGRKQLSIKQQEIEEVKKAKRAWLKTLQNPLYDLTSDRYEVLKECIAFMLENPANLERVDTMRKAK